jgi:medium-chain acyl-[acyl-carrier-protein] hydrolase
VFALNPALFEQEYRIHYYEIDYRKKALITSLMNYLDDVAMCQSEKLGVGVDYLKERNIAWMLYKWDIKIHKYPVYGDSVKVKTLPHSFKKFYAYRLFDILNLQGEKLVSANSAWLLINTDKKRPIKITKDMYKAYHVQSAEPLEMEDIKQPSSIDVEKEFHVRYSDIDTNRHVNNVKYAAWAIETLPLDIVLNYTLANLKVTYKKETTYGKTIKALTQVKTLGDSITCLHSIVDEDGKVLCILESRWVKNG